MFAQEHQRGDPAFALPLDALKIFTVEMIAAQDRFGFLGGAGQLAVVDSRNASARDETRELRRRVGARNDDERNAFRDLLESLRKCDPALGLDAHLLKVIEDDRARLRQHGEKIAEEAPREADEIL